MAAPTTLPVAIDIRPGSDENPVNLKSSGVIPVAVLTTSDFDATSVDGGTVLFAGASPDHGDGHLEDVDGDGDLDWLGHFRIQDTDIATGDTEAGLTGKTTGGIPFVGTDTMWIVGGSAKGKASKPAIANVPNPFNPETTISYQLPESGFVSLRIYNTLGQEIRSLVREVQVAGSYQVRWDGRDANGRHVSSGLYLARLESGSATVVRRMLLVK